MGMIKPFGPSIYQGAITEKLRKELLALAFDAKDDASTILVGQLTEQLYLYPEDDQMKVILDCVRTYTNHQNALIEIDPLWVNFQTANDWQPVHNHDGDLSFVCYLDIPKGIYEETPEAGSLYFNYGERQKGSNNVWGPIKPTNGDFFIFPSWLNHYVYPFRSPGQRVSMSGNIWLKSDSSPSY